ncbi:MAG TPA: glutaredoxin domain-containing protein [Anaerolineales bacterium]|jgi:mycoredoxin
MTDLYNRAPTQIVLYGTSWCGDCRRSRAVFAEKGAKYLEIDIDRDPLAARFVREMNNGSQSVPTIIFPDGTILIEPDRATLSKKLENLQPTA